MRHWAHLVRLDYRFRRFSPEQIQTGRMRNHASWVTTDGRCRRKRPLPLRGIGAPPRFAPLHPGFPSQSSKSLCGWGFAEHNLMPTLASAFAFSNLFAPVDSGFAHGAPTDLDLQGLCHGHVNTLKTSDRQLLFSLKVRNPNTGSMHLGGPGPDRPPTVPILIHRWRM